MIFNEQIIEHFSKPRCLGKLTDPDIVIVEGHPVCGDTVNLFIKLGSDGVIAEARFQTYGCATSIALSDMIAEKFQGLSAREIGSISEEEIAGMLGNLSPEQRHCIEIGVSLVRKTLKELDKWRTDDSAASSNGLEDRQEEFHGSIS